MKLIPVWGTLLSMFLLLACSSHPIERNIWLERAEKTFTSLYTNYAIDTTCLLHENYPSDTYYSIPSLASGSQRGFNQYAYLWPYSGVFSAGVALLEATGDKIYKELLENSILPGLEAYYDRKREPHAYSSYISRAPVSDRFYDDNLWLGIDFIDLYRLTCEQQYLEKAKAIWRFVKSGTDDKLGGGIYWCEQRKDTKNTCSNAPAAVLALKIYQETHESIYLKEAERQYEWTKEKLQDTTDYLYFDHIELDGKIGKAKFAYNSGQMMQAAALLFELTGDSAYLTDARNIAKEAYCYFFNYVTTPDESSVKLIRKGDIWFTAIMLRGYIELYKQDKNKTYLDTFKKSLDCAWKYAREENGLFNVDFSGKEKENRKWLLTQAAIVEMYARLAAIK